MKDNNKNPKKPLNLNVSESEISELIQDAYKSDPNFFKELSQL